MPDQKLPNLLSFFLTLIQINSIFHCFKIRFDVHVLVYDFCISFLYTRWWHSTAHPKASHNEIVLVNLYVFLPACWEYTSLLYDSLSRRHQPFQQMKWKPKRNDDWNLETHDWILWDADKISLAPFLIWYSWGPCAVLFYFWGGIFKKIYS